MKGVIIAAGYGTRFLPATKTIPKEMFPLIDTPAIDLIVEEFIQSGVKEILIVSSRRKKSLEDYFDREMELESFFKSKKKTNMLNIIKPKDANFFFIRQKEMLGTGHAILMCKEFIGLDSFVVAYPDDIVFAKVPLTKQLINIHNKTNSSVLAMQKIDGDVSRYGVLDIEKNPKGELVNKIIEKPKAGSEPSKMISIGRYLFKSNIFPILEKGFKDHDKGEFYHIDAINFLAQKKEVYGCLYDGSRIDIGDKLGYLEGIIKYSLSREDLKRDVNSILKKYVK